MTNPVQFKPAVWLRGAHRQTLWSNYARRPHRTPNPAALEHSDSVTTGDGDQIRVHWWRQPGHSPVLIILHGLTGCAGSNNVVGLGAKAAARGFSVVRADLRNASGDTPSVGIGHAGRSEDLVALIEHVRHRQPGDPIAVVGFSLGGNVTLKTAGEYGAAAPAELSAVAAISVPIDLDAACTRIDSPGNRGYRDYFLRRLGRTVKRRRARAPQLYGALELEGIRTLRGFDNAVVAPTCGFDDAEHYYRTCSAIRYVADITVPTLVVQAQDDPFIPFNAFDDERLTGNSAIRLLATRHGGHVGFYAARCGQDPDPFWAENRALDHCARGVGLPNPEQE